MSFLETGTTPQLRAAFRKLQLQRPAFLSDAPRTSDILEEPGSRFRRVLHVDGRRDLNFTTCFTDVPPGDYAVLVRLQLQPGYVRGYCNFRAVFGRPASSLAAKSTRKLAARRQAQAQGQQGPEPKGPRQTLSRTLADLLTLASQAKGKGLDNGRGRGKGEEQQCGPAAAGVGETFSGPEGHQVGGGRPGPGSEANVVPHRSQEGAPEAEHEREQTAAAAAGVAAAFPEIEVTNAPLPPLPPPMPVLAPAPLPSPAGHASLKRDAAYGASASGPPYVSRWLRPLWGSHDCAWHQLDPRGPLGEGAWRTLDMRSVTVRRLADVHLHQVMSQLPPVGAAQAAAAMPPGETRWRGVLVDYVELVPVKQCGLLEGLLPRCLAPRALAVPPAAAGQAPGAAVVHVPTL
ncbi:hypothetical protein HYH03_005068 [Edaphochlamys debaryana]|uniref:Uncharacterized protein n=1 Tax=Edaphochlamys debaryana TaxID=47281 RepID=A0A835Y662_9CHLO|nr:hypothetical protein HYH03_005068 [Edaphochlamys debaryana]|eukprot:KAG2497072.1 hypothetical protein HYH03_005068 [Edaphochlamys debaryana]